MSLMMIISVYFEL